MSIDVYPPLRILKPCTMFVPRDSFEIMKPIILVARLLGICPLTYERKGGYFTLRRSPKLIVYSYLLATILVSFTLIGVINDLLLDEKNSVRMKAKKTRYITCCDISIVIILVVFSIFTAPFKFNSFTKMIQCYNSLDAIIPLTNIEKYKKNSRNFIILIGSIFTLIVIFDCVVWDTLSKKGETRVLFWKNYSAFYLLYYVVIGQEIFFGHTVYFAKIRLELLNKTLKSEAKLLEALRIRKNSSTNDADKVVKYSRFYDKLIEAIECINANGGLVIIIILLSCLIHLIVTPYFWLYEISNNGNKIFITLQTIWLLTHISRLLLLVEPCHKCLIESFKTVNLVCEIMTYSQDKEAKKALSVLAMQLSYCKIKFYSCGLVKIDRSIITAVVGAVTTYLVILFQFNKF